MNLPTPAQLLQALPAPQQRARLVAGNQSADDIVNEILNAYNDNTRYYDAIVRLFPNLTPQQCFWWCKAYMPYKVESFNSQCVYNLPALLDRADQGGTFDCKSYASFIVSLWSAHCRATGKTNNAYFAFASDTNQTEPTHTFAIINGIWVDPCFRTINEPHRYLFLIKIQPMALYRISGPINASDASEDYTIGNIFSDIKHAVNVNVSNLRKSADVNLQNVKKGANVNLSNLKKGADISIYNVRKGVSNTFDKAKHNALKVALAANRNAFLVLLKLNVGLWAVKILEYCQNPDRLNEWRAAWYNLGGDWSVFAKAVNDGYNRWLIRHNHKMKANLHYIGDGGASAVAAALAAATPIIVALLALLKKSGADTNNKQPDGGEQLTTTTATASVDSKGNLVYNTSTDQAGYLPATTMYNSQYQPIDTSVTADGMTVTMPTGNTLSAWWSDHGNQVISVAATSAAIFAGIKILEAIPQSKKRK